jgi:hypothetical protein
MISFNYESIGGMDSRIGGNDNRELQKRTVLGFWIAEECGNDKAANCH